MRTNEQAARIAEDIWTARGEYITDAADVKWYVAEENLAELLADKVSDLLIERLGR